MTLVNSTGKRPAADAAGASRPALLVENSAELDTLKREYYELFPPLSVVERDLVEDLIRDRWLLRRFAAVEDQLLSQSAYTDVDQALGRLHRRASATRKSYKETLKLLESTQAKRKSEVARDEAGEAGRQDSACPSVPSLRNPNPGQPASPKAPTAASPAESPAAECPPERAPVPDVPKTPAPDLFRTLPGTGRAIGRPRAVEPRL